MRIISLRVLDSRMIRMIHPDKERRGRGISKGLIPHEVEKHQPGGEKGEKEGLVRELVPGLQKIEPEFFENPDGRWSFCLHEIERI